jgi:hypothetical protein
LLTDRKGIPVDNPIRVVREDPEHEDLLIAETEYGLYISLNDDETWESFQQNLPIVPIADIKIFRGDLILSIMGRLFWIMDNITPLHQLASSNLRSNDLLFQLKETYRFRYRTSDDDAPNYPVAAGQFDYLLKNSTSNEVTLEIFDENKKAIRSFSSTKQPGKAEQLFVDMSTGSYHIDSKTLLTTEKGLNSFNWDMKLPGPWDQDPEKSFQQGPLVIPGAYTARMTHRGVVSEKTFEIKIDPRLAEVNVVLDDLKAQSNLLEEIIALENASKRALSGIKKLVLPRI